MACIECYNKAKVHPILQIYLCNECADGIKYKLIYKTHVKTLYFLNENDMDDQHKYIIHGKKLDITLYYLRDVQHVFCKKYNTTTDNIEQKIHELTMDKLQHKHDLILKKREKIAKRREILVKHLNKSGLELRADSKLCAGYIDGSIKWNKNEVVNRMCQMKYLYEYINFDECFQEARVIRHNMIENDEELLPTFDIAERIALQKYGPYPAKWPWL